MHDQLILSRSFVTPMTTIADMEQVLSAYAQRAAHHPCMQGSVTNTMSVFASTSPFADGLYESASDLASFPVPTDDPVALVKAAIGTPRPRPRGRTRNVRAGLSNLSPTNFQVLLDVFDTAFDTSGFGDTIDAVTKRHGRSAVGPRNRTDPQGTRLDDEARPLVRPRHAPLVRAGDSTRSSTVVDLLPACLPACL
ncbi:hypothetical protein GSU68_19025 (plasmid) [Rathayibacter sp. VKM Ac-2759]|uniref:DinB/UmuC family translesion DNA polymerase n=1 Tax=Rathayibacter sp. VKM Ac-2759 TaxID=2609252 RepID=UPI001318AA1C|nr:hypothetical protein [Rathayibacter sp. VKM Ac-2759]QHC68794.1 hypothetical protein GSU68_19025 [Rathayibacter sp. VKM Ac-2759]